MSDDTRTSNQIAQQMRRNNAAVVKIEILPEFLPAVDELAKALEISRQEAINRIMEAGLDLMRAVNAAAKRIK